MAVRYLDFVDLSQIAAELDRRDPAEAALLLEPGRTQRALLRPCLSLDGREAYPSVAAKAAALATAILKEQPYAGANEGLAWVAMQQFLSCNERRWRGAPHPGDCARAFQRIQDGEASELELAAWLERRTTGE